MIVLLVHRSDTEATELRDRLTARFADVSVDALSLRWARQDPLALQAQAARADVIVTAEDVAEEVRSLSAGVVDVCGVPLSDLGR